MSGGAPGRRVPTGSSADVARLASAIEAVGRLRAAIQQVMRGKDEVVDLALTAVLGGGHLLLQDVPGVGKTTLAHALASAVGGTFSRIQFTADPVAGRVLGSAEAAVDPSSSGATGFGIPRRALPHSEDHPSLCADGPRNLLPGDITGVSVLDPKTGAFAFREGPLFANVVLADEINRTSPKTQSALFEAMEEGQVTGDGLTRPLPRPFLVVATQNPFDHHGTFQLPDSQLDRFMMRLEVGYPDREAERDVLRSGGLRRQQVEPVLQLDQMTAIMDAVDGVAVAREVEDYLLDLVRTTRTDARFVRGVSPRGAQSLYRAVRARALVRSRGFVVPEDVRDLACPVLAHRVIARSTGPFGGDGGARAAIQALLDELRSPL